MIKIDKGIEIPTADRKRKSIKHKYPFRYMESGDSFFVMCDADNDVDKLLKRMSQNAHRALGSGNYAVRRYDDGVRVWKK